MTALHESDQVIKVVHVSDVEGCIAEPVDQVYPGSVLKKELDDRQVTLRQRFVKGGVAKLCWRVHSGSAFQ